MIGICAIAALRRLARRVPKHVLDALAVEIVKHTTGTPYKPPGSAQPTPPLWSAAGEALKKLQTMEKKHRPRAAVQGLIVPTGRARSLATGKPLATPCGRPCEAAVVIVTRLTAPRRTLIYQYLPCTRGQARQALGRDHAAGLLSFHELAAAHKSVEQLDDQMRCTVPRDDPPRDGADSPRARASWNPGRLAEPDGLTPDT